MRRRRTRPGLALLCCLPLTAGCFFAGRQVSFGPAALAAGSFLTAPRQAVGAARQWFSLEAGEKEPVYFEQVPTETAPQAPATGTPAGAALARPENAGTVTDAAYRGSADEVTVQAGAGLIKNCTALPRQEVEAAVSAPMPFLLEKNSGEVQVLILHTHATECYQPADTDWYDPAWPTRTTDTQQNMAAVGAVLAETLNGLGIRTLQDTTLHDYPSYNGSYDRSRATAERYLARYPSIKVVLDIHRDAIEQADGTRMRPVIETETGRTAQLMVICAADDGTRGMPDFKQNLRFAAALQDAVEKTASGLARPVLFDYRNYNYNQQLSAGCLLVEVGGHANTLEQAKAAAVVLGRALASLAG